MTAKACRHDYKIADPNFDRCAKCGKVQPLRYLSAKTKAAIIAQHEVKNVMPYRAILFNAPQSELDRIERDTIEELREDLWEEWGATLNAGDSITIEET